MPDRPVAEPVAGPGAALAEAFAEAFAASPVAQAIFEVERRRLVAVNHAFAAELGYVVADLESRPIADFIAERDIRAIESRLAVDAADRGQLREMRWRRADGTEALVRTRFDVTAAGSDGRHAHVVLSEVEAEPKSTAGVPDARKFLQDIIDGVPALVFIKDLEGRYILANRRTRELYRVDGTDKTDHDIMISVEEAHQFRQHDAEVLTAGEPREFEEWSLHDGERHTYYSLKFPLFDLENRVYGLCGVSTDVTALKRAETTAREARDEAERANRAKSRFLSLISHELRTPLHSILGYCQLLQIEGMTLDVPATAGRMISAGEHLLELINDLLDLSRIEQGAEQVLLEPVHACDPVREAVDIVRPLAAARDLELAVDLHGGLHEFVSADRRRLHQVLLNLLTNGINYNRPGGEVRVSFRRAARDRLRFLVSDTGSGIRRRDFERAFLPFERLDQHEDHGEGAGLGLAVSKALIEAMGGSIGIESSETDRGTTLFVELDLVAPPVNAHEIVFAPGRAQPADGLALQGTILYIEDHAPNVELIEQALGHVGDVTLVPAARGDVGLHLAAELRPDLILLDLHLPDIPGETVLQRLLQDRRTHAIPVIVLSADATPARIERARVAGVSAYLTKPLDLLEFIETVREALEPAVGESQ